jgi:hypothetical protein
MDQPTKRPIVVILGMHRSGTSLVANFMHAIGVDFGQDLLPADEGNEAGYWESRKIFDTHEKILKELNCEWHNPPLSFPLSSWRKPRIQELKKDLLDFVRSECKRAEKIWGFKDPRTAILLPLWQEIFDELRLEPHYILTIRHPNAVTASLNRRHGLSSSRSLALWFKTCLLVLSHSRNHPLVIVDYDSWFNSGLEQARTIIEALNLTNSIGKLQMAEAVDSIALPHLRHHRSEQAVASSPTVERFYSLMRQAAIDGKVSDEILALTEPFERARDILNIWDELLEEREALLADRDAKIEADRTRLRKQKQLFTYITVSVVAVFSLLFLFMLFGGHNWFK